MAAARRVAPCSKRPAYGGQLAHAASATNPITACNHSALGLAVGIRTHQCNCPNDATPMARRETRAA
eukprot:5537150-Lingulodinium_polyedra.AAC.1